VQFLRTTSSYASWMPAIVGFVKWCKWTRASLLFIRGTLESTATELSHQFFLSNLKVMLSVSFDEDEEDGRLSNQLQAIEDLRSSKVVLALAFESTYLKIALAVRARGMVSGWAFLGLDTVPSAANYAPIERRADASLAFDGWVYFEPQFAAGQDFFDRVHNATQFDFPTLFDKDVLPNRYAAAMYDAITLCATVASKQSWHPDLGGKVFLTQSIANTSAFHGATGTVKLDMNGDLVLDLQVINLVRTNGTSQRIAVGVFRTGTRSYANNGIRIIWPGSLLVAPTDSEVAAALDLQMIVIGAVMGAVLVALLLLAIYVMRSHRLATRRILVSFMKHEGVLGVRLAWEFWVREPLSLPRCLSHPSRSESLGHRPKRASAGSGWRPYEGLAFSLCFRMHPRAPLVCTSFQLSQPLSERT
jgi:hypothetical protein